MIQAITHNSPVVIIDLVSKAWRVDNCELHLHPTFLKYYEKHTKKKKNKHLLAHVACECPSYGIKVFTILNEHFFRVTI